MGIRQKEKSEMTKTEIKDAMLSLFLDKGYENTSIKDITDQAGYSVGSFYRHWESKQQAFMEFWDEYIADSIKGSVSGSVNHFSCEDMIDYLLERSEQFANNEITIKLYKTSSILSATYDHKGVFDWASRYTEMLYAFLKQVTGCEDEERLRSTAGILHSLLNVHAMKHAKVTPEKYKFNNETLRDCMIAIVNTCK
ncbi:hypothetical protein AGMMS49546_19200 [Spirochaetia bacterium]|nr:hypothetical protein AGMMS49546_19200 [Spirochaetia bacterium]